MGVVALSITLSRVRAWRLASTYRPLNGLNRELRGFANVGIRVRLAQTFQQRSVRLCGRADLVQRLSGT